MPGAQRDMPLSRTRSRWIIHRPPRDGGPLRWSREMDNGRSRRAILSEAAGVAGAVVASAALPLTVAAHDPDDMQLAATNSAPGSTVLNCTALDTDAFVVHAANANAGSGIVAAGAHAPGSGRTAASKPRCSRSTETTRKAAAPADTVVTGVYGFAPTAPDPNTSIGSGVWGDSPDIGVYGSGSVGVEGLVAGGSLGSRIRPSGASACMPRQTFPRGRSTSTARPISAVPVAARSEPGGRRSRSPKWDIEWKPCLCRAPFEQGGALRASGRSHDRPIHDLPEHDRHLGDIRRLVRARLRGRRWIDIERGLPPARDDPPTRSSNPCADL